MAVNPVIQINKPKIGSQGHSREEVACYLEGARCGDVDRRHRVR
jgi:hypothetical protein